VPSSKTDQPLRDVAPGNLLAFVGRQLAVREIAPPDGEAWFDRAFEARYQILSMVYGTYREPEIRFTLFDHKTPSDLPTCARDEIALLYLSRHPAGFVHEKYLCDKVYPTRDGRWAGCGPSTKDARYLWQIRPHPVDFSPEVVFPADRLTPDQIEHGIWGHYLELRGQVAVCTAGLFADELFEVSKRRVLRARHLFE